MVSIFSVSLSVSPPSIHHTHNQTLSLRQGVKNTAKPNMSSARCIVFDVVFIFRTVLIFEVVLIFRQHVASIYGFVLMFVLFC